MESTNSDAKATSTDAGVSTLPTVYTSGMPPTEPPPTTSQGPLSTSMVDGEFLRSVDSLLKVVEIVR